MTRQQNTYLPLLSGLLVLFSLPVVKGQINILPATTEIKIDGHLPDWDTPFRYYDAESKLAYSIMNNDTSLYIALQIFDGLTQTKVMRAGMEVNLSFKGQYKRKASVRFPIINEDERLVQANGFGVDNLRQTFVLNHFRMETGGFEKHNGGHVIHEGNAIRAGLNWDADVMNYELAIPLRELCGQGCGAKELSEEITLKVIVNGMDKPKGAFKDENMDLSSTGGNMQPGMTPGMDPSGMPGRDIGNQGVSNMNSDPSGQFDRQTLKVKFQLVAP